MDLQQPTSGETTIPDACAICGGDVHLRVRDGHATAYCATCHLISHPSLKVRHDRLELSIDTAAKA